MYGPGACRRQLSRRAVLLLLLTCVLVLNRYPISAHNASSNSGKRFSTRDEILVADLERRAFQYFWENAGASTGLVLDRTRTDGRPAVEDHRTVASIAATGFGLTAICIAAERGWIKREVASERVRTTLRVCTARSVD